MDCHSNIVELQAGRDITDKHGFISLTERLAQLFTSLPPRVGVAQWSQSMFSPDQGAGKEELLDFLSTVLRKLLSNSRYDMHRMSSM
ncbi:uncharacterized protein J3R85_002008 [Psidium guajava]|nr:uncharacterized protein J3R85_002008 [Psidium guajava]